MEERAGPSSSMAELEDDDSLLANSEFLTRQELLKRRSRRLRRLANCYRDHYWSLMEELKRKHRDFYWKFGKSPFREVDGGGERESGALAGTVNDNHHKDNTFENESDVSKLGLGLVGGFNQCAFSGCKSKAMALSRYCHPHILSDTKQNLYKPCKFAYKITVTGPVPCGKPILKSAIPSLCPIHVQKTQKILIRELKKGGIPVAASTKLASKFHLVITEYVRVIQTERRAL